MPMHDTEKIMAMQSQARKEENQMGERYLRQKVTGDIFVWTEILAIREDMIECDTDVVKNRVAGMKQKVLEAKKELENAKPISVELAADSRMLADLELEHAEIQEKIREKRQPEDTDPEPKTAEEAEEALNQAEIDEDPEIIKIMGMDNPKEIALYITSEYGEKIDVSKKKDIESLNIEALRVRAIQLRSKRIMEK